MSASAAQSSSFSPSISRPSASGSGRHSVRAITACAAAAAVLVGAGAYAAAAQLDANAGQSVTSPAATLRAQVAAPTALGGLIATDRPVAVVRHRYRSGTAADGVVVSPSAKRDAAVATFSVTGVPGAQGQSVTTAHTVSLVTRYARGRYDYVVSVRLPKRSPGELTRSQLSSAAAWLYLAGNGCVAPAHATHSRAPSIPAPQATGRI